MQLLHMKPLLYLVFATASKILQLKRVTRDRTKHENQVQKLLLNKNITSNYSDYRYITDNIYTDNKHKTLSKHCTEHVILYTT